MELLDFVRSIGGHIDFSGDIGDDNSLMVKVVKGYRNLDCRPYPGGSGSITGRAKIKSSDISAAYEDALVDLAETFNDLDCKQVGFDVQPLHVVPELTHTKGYRTKAKKVKS